MAANLNVFKTSKKGCILSKSNFSFAEVHWVRYRTKYENKNFDDMGTLTHSTKTFGCAFEVSENPRQTNGTAFF